MPRRPTGGIYKLRSGRGYGIRWRDENGDRHFKSPFETPAAAQEWYDTTILPWRPTSNARGVSTLEQMNAKLDELLEAQRALEQAVTRLTHAGA